MVRQLNSIFLVFVHLLVTELSMTGFVTIMVHSVSRDGSEREQAF